MKNYRLSFEMMLCDQQLAKTIEKFFTVHMHLMRDWGDFDLSKALFGSKGHPVLFSYLPESFIGDLIETFDCVIRTNQKECRAF